MKVLCQDICKSKINWFDEISQELKVDSLKLLKISVALK